MAQVLLLYISFIFLLFKKISAVSIASIYVTGWVHFSSPISDFSEKWIFMVGVTANKKNSKWTSIYSSKEGKCGFGMGMSRED